MKAPELERYLKELRAGRLSRRGFLYIAATTGTASLIAACAPAATPTTAPPTAVPPTPTRAPAAQPTATPAPPTATPAPAVESDLFLYNWADYTNPENVDAFSKQFKVKVTQDFYPSNEDLLAKVQAGGTGYDIVVPTGYMVSIMVEAGLLLDLDLSKIPNFKFMGARFAKDRPHDPTNRWSVTKDWGTTGIAWNSELIKENITSWADFWTLAKKYSGKVSVLDSSPEVIGATLKLLGYGYNTGKRDELDAALKKLLELKPYLKTFDSVAPPLLATDEVWMALTWNGDAFFANAQRKKAGKAESINYIIPKEGSEVWEDDWCMLKTAPHPKAAHAWINFVLDPPNQGKETNFTYYASGSDEAAKYIDKEILNNPAIYPAAEVLAKLEAAQKLPKEVLQYREELWTKLKSA